MSPNRSIDQSEPKQAESPIEAEARATDFIKIKHPKVMKIFFRRITRDGRSWLMEGEFWFRRVHLFTVRRYFRLEIGTSTGEITSYEETRHHVPI